MVSDLTEPLLNSGINFVAGIATINIDHNEKTFELWKKGHYRNTSCGFTKLSIYYCWYM